MTDCFSFQMLQNLNFAKSMNFSVVHIITIFTVYFVKERLALSVVQPMRPNKVNCANDIDRNLSLRALPVRFCWWTVQWYCIHSADLTRHMLTKKRLCTILEPVIESAPSVSMAANWDTSNLCFWRLHNNTYNAWMKPDPLSGLA
jgi:hypothetical protein